MKIKFSVTFILVVLFLISYVEAEYYGPRPKQDFHVTLNENSIPDDQFNLVILRCLDKPMEDKYKNEFNSWFNSTYDQTNNCYTQIYASQVCNLLSSCSRELIIPENFSFAVYIPSQKKVYLSELVINKSYFLGSFNLTLYPNGSISVIDVVPNNVSYYNPYSNVHRPQTMDEYINSALYKTENAIKKILPGTVTILLAISLLIIYLLLEIIPAFAYIKYKKISYLVLISVFATNFITLPIHLLYKLPPNPNLLHIVLNASIYLVIDCVFIYTLNKKRITLKDSAILSITMNIIRDIVIVIISPYILNRIIPAIMIMALRIKQP
ncbi:MAG: hypothetical protein V1859_02940 [archaeon]